MDPDIQNVIAAMIAAIKGGLFPPGIPAGTQGIEDYYNTIIPVIVQYARDNPSIFTAPPGMDSVVQGLADALAQAQIELVTLPEDPDAVDDEDRARIVSYFNLMVPATVNACRTIRQTYSVFLPPYGQGWVENTPTLVAAFVSVITGNFYPPAMPASQSDVAMLTAYYNLPVPAFVNYARQNPSLLGAAGV